MDGTTGAGIIRRTKRDVAPAHYSLKIQSFSLLAKTKGDKYESEVFRAGGYNWRLCIYPNGNKKSNGKDHISLYVAIEDVDTLPSDWEVNVDLKLFVLDQINNKYLTVDDGEVKRFHKMKTEFGIAQLISLETFNNLANGYLSDDCCVFGAEIFVIKRSSKWESLSMVKNPVNGSFTWTIDDFSKLDDEYYFSDAFSCGERSWKLKVYPKGCGEWQGNSLSLFLTLVDGKKLSPKKRVWAEYILRVLDQRRDQNKEKTGSNWFSSSNPGLGYRNFMPLGDLHESWKGFVFRDVLKVEVQILVVSVSKVFP